MIQKLMKKYALSEQGARGFVKAAAACVLSDLSLMFPVGLLYLFITACLSGENPSKHAVFYLLLSAVCLVLIYAAESFKYNSTYTETYKESGRIRISLAEKLRKLPLSFFGMRNLSDLTTTIMGDVATTEQMLSHYVPQFYASVLSTSLIALMLLFYDWRMTLASLWVFPCSLLVVFVSREVQKRFSARKAHASLKVEEEVQEYLENSRELKNCRAEARYLKNLSGDIEVLEKRHMQAELGTAAFVAPSSLLLKIGIGSTALFGGIFLKNGTLSLPVFFLYLLMVSRIYEPMIFALQNLAAINALQVNIDRMNAIYATKEQEGTMPFRPENYDIAFDGVDFSYHPGEPVLKNVSFKAKQGEITALIGPSGSGKSTAARLAARLWDPVGGTVRIGGQNIRDVRPEELLKDVSMVFQDVTLFDNTVMENIRVGRESATDEEVIEAARAAQCDEFVSKLRDGYQTVIGENGAFLSGGERQRISIARALLKDAPIILLDEATASLDSENETDVQRAISKLVDGKTVLVIAHRMRTVAGANQIVVLSEGRVVESGSPRELLKKGGLYARMHDLQLKSDRWTIGNQTD